MNACIEIGRWDIRREAFVYYNGLVWLLLLAAFHFSFQVHQVKKCLRIRVKNSAVLWVGYEIV